MASVTSNASCSPSSISIRGRATSTGTISWSLPNIPSGATINSCKLTGKASAFTTGSSGATVTINGTSITSNQTFTINLSNTSATSVTVSCVGAHSQTNTSVSFSNLVYTVEYTVNYTLRVAEYKFNNTLYNLFPIFNEGYNYTYTDIANGNVTTRTIYSDTLPTEIYFGNENESNDFSNSLLEVEYICCDNLYWMVSLFDWCENLTYVNATNWNTSNVISMNSTFSGCTSLTTINGLSDWDTSQVTDMSYMFQSCTSLIALNNISDWDTSQVNYMINMFFYCASLEELNLSNWDTSNVINMYGMFDTCWGLRELNVERWNVNKVELMNEIFDGCLKLSTIIMENSDNESINKIIAILPTRSADNPGTLQISKDNINQVNTSIANSKNWEVIDVSSDIPVTYKVAEYKFDNTLYNLIPYFNDDFKYTLKDTMDGNVTTRTIYSKSLPSIMCFGYRPNDDGNGHGIAEASDSLLEVTYLNTSKLITMWDMFRCCHNVVKINADNWDVGNVYEMSCTFEKCTNLISLNASNWNKNRTSSMPYMFAYCESLRELDLSNWDCTYFSNIYGMVGACSNLEAINLSNWKVYDIYMDDFFHIAENLSVVIIDNSNYEFVNQLIQLLPTKTSKNRGVLSIVGIDDINQVDTSTANSKYWNVVSENIVAQYKFNNSSYNLIPAFNEGYNYNYVDAVNGSVTTRTIYSSDLPTNMYFGQNDIGNSASSLLEIIYLNTNNLNNMDCMFYNCNNLTKINMSNWNTNNVNSMYLMFSGCVGLNSLDLTHWDVRKVENMEHMFSECANLTKIDLSNWNVSNVITMAYMFYHCPKLKEIKGLTDWNVSSVISMRSMFSKCDIVKLDLTSFKLTNCTSIRDMFGYCTNLQTLILSDDFCTSGALTDMQGVFVQCNSLKSLDLSNWNITNVSIISWMFQGCTNLTTLNISNWRINDTTASQQIFLDSPNITTVIMNNSDYNTVNKIIAQLPTRASNNRGILQINGVDNYSQVNTSTANSKYWNTTNGYIVAQYKFNNTLANFMPEFNDGYNYNYIDTVNGNVTTRTIYSDSLPTLIRFGTTSTGTDRENSLLELLYLETSNLTDMLCLVNGCQNLTKINCSDWDVSKVTNMGHMFGDCQSLTELDLSNWDVDNVEYIDYMFHDCQSLITVGDLSNWDVGKVTNMEGMFYGCHSLILTDLSNWDVGNVTNMEGMFWECCSLPSLDLSNWNINNATNMNYMFRDCYSLKTLNLSGWNLINNTLEEMLVSYTFNNSFILDTIIMNNSNYNSVNKIIAELPTRTSNSRGILQIENIDNINQVNTSTANSKYWDVAKNKIIEYLFYSAGTDLYPTLNDGFTYYHRDIVIGYLIKRIIYSNQLPTVMSFENSDADSLFEVNYIDTSNLTTGYGMFAYCNYLFYVNTDNFDTSKMTNICGMFAYCENLPTIDVSNFNTENVTNTSYIFQGCKNLTTIIGLDNWNVSNVITMEYMFSWCYNLNTFNAPNCKTSKLTNIYGMFAYCENLTTANLTNWDVSKVTNMEGVFYDCYSLRELNINNWILNSNVNLEDIFSTSNDLSLVKMNNSNYTSVNKIISILPTKTNNNRGTLDIVGIDNINQVNTSTASSKYWNVFDETLIARYTANASGVVPTFNSGYQYTKKETNSNGIYTVELRSNEDFTSCSFSGKTNLLTVEYLKVTNNVTNMGNMFNGCNNLTTLDVSNWDTSNVTDALYMFYNCQSLTSLDVSNFDTSKVNDMECMFYNCNNLTSLDVSNFNTSNVTDMRAMFYSCKNLTSLDVSNFNTSNVTDMRNMFSNCNKLTTIDLSNFDTSNVTTMDSMFANCNKLTTIDLSNFDTSNVTTMDSMFANCSLLNKVIATNVSTSTLSTLVTALPTKKSDSYGTINTENTTDEITSSANAKYWNIDISILIAKYTANASGVVPTFNSGYQYTKKETESNGIYTVELRSDTDFTSCSFSEKSNLLTIEYLKVTNNLNDMSLMFNNCTNLTSVNTSNWDTSKVVTMAGTFYNCQSLVELNIKDWDTRNVQWLNATFYNCKSLTTLEISNWDTRNVINMNSLFGGCNNLTQLDVSNWNTENITDMNGLFLNCSKLISLDLSNWNTSKANMTDMFYNCTSLKNIGMIYSDINTVNKIASYLPYLSELTRVIYVQDVLAEQCTSVQGIEFKDYKVCRQAVQIPIQLVNEAELYWDEELGLYCIKDSSNNIIQTNIINPIALDTYNPYYKIITDENENAPTSITANVAMKEIKK